MVWTHRIKSLHEFNEDEYSNLTTIYPDCFNGIITLQETKLLGDGGPIEVMSMQNNSEYIFMCLLHRYKGNNIYISDVCVPKKWRGKGVMESAFKYIADYYGKKGTYFLTLTASNERIQNLNQKKRMKIFNKHDFYLSPTHIAISGYGSDDSSPISVSLTNGKHVNIKSGPLREEGFASKYIVRDSDGNEFKVSMDEIEACFTKSTIFGHSQVHCPMKKTLKKGGKRINTRKGVFRHTVQ